MIKFELIDSDKIKREIAIKGYSYRSFSRKIGISHSYLSQILNRKKMPSAPVAKKISEGLGINIEDFFSLLLVDELPKV